MRLYKAPLLLIIIQLFLFNQVIAQDADKKVTLTVTGQGKTIDEAKTNALRSAIEQAFGAFVSSKTEIVKDKITKDEVISVSNGNVQEYQIVDKKELPNGDNIVTLKATVSILKLVTYFKNKGVSIEFNGGLFAQNIAIQELNERNELIAWQQVKNVFFEIIKNAFTYKLSVSQPLLLEGNFYTMSYNISIEMNENYKIAMKYLQNFISSVSLSDREVEDYASINKRTYRIVFPDKPIHNSVNSSLGYSDELYFIRNSVVYSDFWSIPDNIQKQVLCKIKISNGLNSFSLTDLRKKGIGIFLKPQIMGIDNFRSYLHKYGISSVNTGRNLYTHFYQIFWGVESDEKMSNLMKNYYIIDPVCSPDYLSSDMKSDETALILNYVCFNKFFDILFFDKLAIEDIKKITEFKIQ